MPDPVSGEDRTPKEEIDFIKNQAPGAKYIISVCTGSFHLATAGVLEGKRATTNKKFFRFISVCPYYSVLQINNPVLVILMHCRPLRAKR